MLWSISLKLLWQDFIFCVILASRLFPGASKKSLLGVCPPCPPLARYWYWLHFIISSSPATVILIMSGGLQLGLSADGLALLICLVVISLGYGLICLYTSQDFQLKTARFLTLIFALLMSATLVGLLIQVAENPGGESSPTTKPGIVKGICFSPYKETNTGA